MCSDSCSFCGGSKGDGIKMIVLTLYEPVKGICDKCVKLYEEGLANDTSDSKVITFKIEGRE